MESELRPAITLSEPDLLHTFDPDQKRPNLMVLCHEVEVTAVMKHLLRYCERPYHFIAVPGHLHLPTLKRGTLFIADVAGLTLAQQIQLYDCISSDCEALQVVSLTTVPLELLVQSGQFFESLYYRLNVVRLDARPTVEVLTGAH